MTETWYVMVDGSCGDPREITPDAKGVLRHKDGRVVEYKPHGPRTRGVKPDEERGKKTPSRVRATGDKPPHDVKDMKAEEAPRPYRTRESKAD